MEKNKWGFSTQAIHAGIRHGEMEGSLAPPIFQTSTFVFPSAETGGNRFAGREDGFIYTRLGNPTVRLLEEKVAVLEKAETALAFSSGMGAVASVLLGILKAGDHVGLFQRLVRMHVQSVSLVAGAVSNPFFHVFHDGRSRIGKGDSSRNPLFLY